MATDVRKTMPKIRGLKQGVKFIAKNITIRSDHDDYLKKHSISLSRFVQQRLDEAMSDGKEKK